MRPSGLPAVEATSIMRPAAATAAQQNTTTFRLCEESIFCSLFDVDGSSLAVTLHIVLVRIEGVLAIFVGYL